MGFLSSTTRSIEKVEREKKRNAGVGVLIKAVHDARPPKTGVDPIGPLIKERWDKKARKYRYSKGVRTITGRPLGGKYAPVPWYAPSERKPKGKKKRPGK